MRAWAFDLTPPLSQTAECSSNTTFTVTATGQPPLAYQWSLRASPILDATSSTLTLTGVGFAQAGQYSVVITNAYGSATGGPAVLTIVDTTPPTILACASNRTLSGGRQLRRQPAGPDPRSGCHGRLGLVTVIQNPPVGTLLGLGATNVAFTVRDSSGNSSVCISSLTVVDTTPPFVQACVLRSRWTSTPIARRFCQT